MGSVPPSSGRALAGVVVAALAALAPLAAPTTACGSIGTIPDAATGADSGSVGTGACATPGSGLVATLGCPCVVRSLACNGNAQAEVLECSGGTWKVLEVCPAGQNCDSAPDAPSACAPIVAVCADVRPGAGVCTSSTSLVVCGPDRVTVTNMNCSGATPACQGGACVVGSGG